MFSKNIFPLLILLIIITIIIGCGGGGGNIDTNYAGNWIGTWKFDNNFRSGTLSLIIETNGTVLGLMTPTGLLGGTYQNSSFTMAGDYVDVNPSFTFAGTFYKENGHLIGRFGSGEEAGSFDLVPNTQTNKYSGSWSGITSWCGTNGQSAGDTIISFTIDDRGVMVGNLSNPYYGEATLLGMSNNNDKFCFTYQFSKPDQLPAIAGGTFTYNEPDLKANYSYQVNPWTLVTSSFTVQRTSGL